MIDYYRGGYDESTVGGTLVVRGSTFTDSGADEENGVLINTYGIINVDLSDNEFRSNDVERVARPVGRQEQHAHRQRGRGLRRDRRGAESAPATGLLAPSKGSGRHRTSVTDRLAAPVALDARTR